MRRKNERANPEIIFALALLTSIFGCSNDYKPTQQQIDTARERWNRYHEIQHTGPVTVIDISVSYCESYNGGKSGTGICDRALALETPDHKTFNLGLCRTGQWPPVWHGMKADIYFKLHYDDWDDHDCAIVDHAEELK